MGSRTETIATGWPAMCQNAAWAPRAESHSTKEIIVRTLLLLIGGALVLMWALGLIFRIPGIFVWFLLGFGIVAAFIGWHASEEM